MDDTKKEILEWKLDLDAAEKTLPAPGEYPGTIMVTIREKPDVLWMIVEHWLDQPEAVADNAIVAIQARPGSEFAPRVVEGQRLLSRLCAACGIDVTEVSDPFAVPRLLNGQKLLLTVAHKKVDGITSLVVRGYRALGS